MKKFYTILLIVLLGGLTAKAQVGIGTASPDASAQLEILSASKGLLVPRLTLLQRNAINAPANGLLIYQTDNTSGFYFYNSSQWQRLANDTEIQAGAPGENGKTVLNGTTVPLNTVGTDGDFYLNTSNATLYGPKASGNWPTGITLVGPQGPQGEPGLQGPAGTFSGSFSGDITGTADATVIATDAVTTAKIKDAAVTNDKIATGISAAKVGLGNVNNTSDADKPLSATATTALAAKENTITAGTTSQYFRGDKTFQTLDKTAVGLANADNTSDANKPVSTATQTALNAKENSANKAIDLSDADDTKFPTTKAVADALTASASGKENTITAGTTSQYFRGDKTFQTLDKTTVGLANADNTSDANKPVSTATQTALNAKENSANKATDLSDADDTKFPTTKAVADALTASASGKENTITAGTTSQYFRGDKTFQTLDKTTVGLANADNTSDANKPVSTATQTALNAKESSANKATDLTDADDTKFPTTKAVADALTASASGKENAITAGTTSQYFRGDKTFQTLDKTAVGLGNADNTSDANKPVSTATQTALNAKENSANKATDLSDADDTKFPTTKAVADALATSTATAWSKTGNTGTADGTDFIGTTDAQPLNFKVNNQKAGRIDYDIAKANAFWGYQAGNLTTGANNTANGYQVLLSNTTGYSNTANGTQALSKNTTGASNTANGYQALYANTTGSYNTAVGYFADVSAGNLINATAIGYNAKVDAGNKVQIGNTAVTSVKLGGTTAVLETSQIKLTGGSPGANKILTSDANGLATWATPASFSWSMKGNAGTTNTDFIGTTDDKPLKFKINNEKAGEIEKDLGNAFWGYQAGNGNIDGGSNTAVGFQALLKSNGYNNTANGYMALYENTGDGNTANGASALVANTSGHSNTATGWQALNSNTTGESNTANGRDALYSNQTGSNNTALGFGADVSTGSLTNATAIGSGAIVNASNKVQIGNTAVTAVKLGGTTAVLETSQIKLTGGSPGANKVLTSDANGLATWAIPVSSGWGMGGNTGTTDGTDFIGTTDDKPLNIRVNNEKAGRIDANLYNTFWGYQAGNANTTGRNNTANGSQALSANTEGYSNTANGTQALYHNTTGYFNTANGTTALYSNTEGYSNTANGLYALYSNTTGSKNTALGYGANVSTGELTNATVIGYNAIVNASNKVQIGNDDVTAVKLGGTTAVLETSQIKLTGGSPGANKVLTSDADGLATWVTPVSSGWGMGGNAGTTDGTDFIGTTDDKPLNFKVNNQKAGRIDYDNIKANTFWGYQAGNANTTGAYNSANGYAALQSNTTGVNNTANGFDALYSNTEGYSNTANGFNALYLNTTGNYNTANGFQALLLNIGSNNTANGSSALQSNSTGNNNTAIGNDALLSNTTGNNNTASGYTALQSNKTGSNNTANGYSALYNNTTGSSNTANGFEALWTNTTGSYNTAIGRKADVSTSNLSNATVIGFGATVNASNKVRIGNTYITVIEGEVPFTNASDRRFKTDIKPMDKGLDFMMQLKPVSYQMKNSSDKRSNWGFIAQDIEALVGTNNAVLTIGQDSLRSLGLRYTDFISPMVKAIQELNEESEKLKVESGKLKAENEKIKAENEALKTELATIKARETEFASRLAKIETLLNKTEMAKPANTVLTANIAEVK